MGCTFFDTAEICSPNLSSTGHNERIVGKALQDVRKGVVLSTKLFLDRPEVRRDGSVYDTIVEQTGADLFCIESVTPYLKTYDGLLSAGENCPRMAGNRHDGAVHPPPR